MSDVIESNYPAHCRFCANSIKTKKAGRYMCALSDIPGITMDWNSTCAQFNLAKEFVGTQYHDCSTCLWNANVSLDMTEADCVKHGRWVDMRTESACDSYKHFAVMPKPVPAQCRNCVHMLPAYGYHPGDNACFCVRPLPWWLNWLVSTPRVKKLYDTCKHIQLKAQNQR